MTARIQGGRIKVITLFKIGFFTDDKHFQHALMGFVLILCAAVAQVAILTFCSGMLALFGHHFGRDVKFGMPKLCHFVSI